MSPYSNSPCTFTEIIESLEAHYGDVEPPSRDPLELIILENIAYLADDKRREIAFAELRGRVGIEPANILQAKRNILAGITKAGILPEIGVEKLLQIARIALEEFDSDLNHVLRMPMAQALKALKKFPGIGQPGAEKILLFCGVLPVLALESNGLRVLLRLGYGQEAKSYSSTYRSVQSALSSDAPKECAPLTRVHMLLRKHGKELCKLSRPQCEICPVKRCCWYFSRTR